MAAVNDVSQLVDKRGGSYAAIAPKLEPRKFNKWKKRMLCYLSGMEPYYLKWNDIMESVISYVSAKETWADLVHSFEGPSDTKENMIMDLKLEYQTFKAKSTESLSRTYTRYKTLLNEIANDGVNFSKHEIIIGFMNSLPEKRFFYEDNLIQRRYSDTKKALITTPLSTAISTAFFSNNVIQDFQENSNEEVDERSSEEYLRDLDIEYHERALLANSKCFIKKRNNFSGQKANENTECTNVETKMMIDVTVGKSHACNGEWVDITIRKVNILFSMDKDADWQTYLNEQIPHQKKKVLGGELFTESSSKMNEKEKIFVPASMGMIHVEALYTPPLTTMSLITSKERHIRGHLVHGQWMLKDITGVRVICTNCRATRERIHDIIFFHMFGCPVFIHNHKDHLGKFYAKADDGYFLGYSFISKAFRVFNHARNGEWVDITIRKVNTLLSMDEDVDCKNYLKYINIDLNEQIPHQKKKVLGGELFTELSSRMNDNENLFIPASMGYDQEMVPKIKDWVERLNPDSKLLNFNTRRLLVPESQAVNESLKPTENTPESSKDSEVESLTPLHSLKIFRELHQAQREDHRTLNHEMYIASLKRSENYKAQPYQYTSPSKQILKAKAKPFPSCTHCGFNDHRPGDYRNYPKCEIYESYDHFTSGHNRRHIREPIWYLESGGSKSMTGVKSYLHKYVEQPGPKVVFGNNSSCITEGYGSINCGGIIFIKVAFVNGFKYNLISINQLCDAKYIVQFDDKQETIFNANKEIVLIAPRRNDVYVLDMSLLTPNRACFFAKASESIKWLWHKRVSHLNFKNIKKLAKQNKVLGLPSLVYSKDKPCSACEKGKHHRASFKTKQNFSIRKSLHLLHMDLFGPVSPMSINYEKYTLVIIDEYSRERIPNISYFHVFECPVFIHNHKDHLGKFNAKVNDGYFLGYSFVSKAFRVYSTRRPKIEESYHVTFDESIEAIRFINTSVDEIGIDDSSRYPPGEFLHEDDPSRQYQVNSDISYYFITHGRSLTELTQENHIPKVIIPNKPDVPLTEETEDPPDLINTEGNYEQNIQNEQITTQTLEVPSEISTKEQSRNNTDVSVPVVESSVPDVPESHILNQASTSSHPVPQDRWSREQHIKLVNIIRNPREGMLTRSMAVKLTVALAKELNQFYRNKVWTLVPLPNGKIAIGSKWVFKNKKDEHGTTTKNKARLVAQGYSQEEGIDYDETFAAVAKIEAIRIFLAFATYMNFKVYQMDVKSAFLNGKIKEEVYVKQPPGFESSEFPNYVCKLDKALYGL
ncbi:retrovirus-related pol polyprotein from transposon TNT 1-94 [Tanacetum coccineum]